jgi:spermidine synthase
MKSAKKQLHKPNRKEGEESEASPVVPAVAVLFFLSGMTGLIYEILWSRQFALLFGTTLPAVTTVLAAFMGGMALGSLVFGRIADRHDHLLRWYGLLELGVGTCAFLSLPAFGLLQRAIPAMARELGEGAAAFHVTRFVVCVVVLGVPATLMGGTLPVLGRALAARREAVGKLVARLYGLNTFGAVLGTVLAGFVLIRFLGLSWAILVTGGVNILVGIAALALDRSLPAPRVAASARGESPGERSRGLGWLLPAYALAGFAALACEIAWSRALALVLGSSIYAITIVLATFLAGIAIGGIAIGRVADRTQQRWQLFAVIEMGIGFMVLLSIVLMGRLPELYLELFWSLSRASFGAVQALTLSLAGLVVLFPTLLMGAAFPVATRLVLEDPSGLGEGVGKLYFANTLGGIAGSVGAGFVMVPQLGTQATLEVAAILFLVVGLYALLRETSLPLPRRGMAAALLTALAAIFVAVVPSWEQIPMVSGVYLYAPQLEDGFHRNQQFLYFREGLHSLVAVTEQAGIRSLRINGKADGSTGEDMVTQVLLAELPLRLHSTAREVLVIGLGTGVTAGAAASHPGVRVSCLEIDPTVVEAASFFRDVNGGALENPSVRIIEADARSWLADASALYDVIISEPSNPWITGVSNLFTREHFESCRERLKPHGLMCQWVHSYSMSLDNLQMILRTFHSVFPRASLWESATGDFLIVGWLDPPAPEEIEKRIRRSWSELAPGEGLLRIGVREPEDLLRRWILDEEGFGRFVGSGPLNTDDKPLLELLSPLSMYSATHKQNRQALEAYSRPRDGL